MDQELRQKKMILYFGDGLDYKWGWRCWFFVFLFFFLGGGEVLQPERAGEKERKEKKVQFWLLTVFFLTDFSEKWKCSSVISDSATPWTVWSPSGSSVHGVLQVRILEWAAIPFFRGSYGPRDWTPISCTADRFFTIWATREAIIFSQIRPSF